MPWPQVARGKSRRPAVAGTDAAAVDEAAQRLAFGRVLAIPEEPACLVVAAAQAAFDRTRPRANLREVPGGMDGCVDHHEVGAAEPAIDAQRPLPQPVHPFARVRGREQLVGGVEGSRLAQSVGDLEEADLVVSQYRLAASVVDPAPGDLEDLPVRGTPVHQVADQVQGQIRTVRDLGPAYEFGEFVAAALDVAHEDGLLHATGIGAPTAGSNRAGTPPSAGGLANPGRRGPTGGREDGP